MNNAPSPTPVAPAAPLIHPMRGEGGHAGVASKGSPGRPRLSDAQMAGLERELERGPLAHGWADQRWTLARVKTVIGRLFHV
ncbi:hypothetical protein OG279_38440 (plasmid) [Streptomyces sp. NBC_01201]|nr:hypothetical protein OG279_38440 [Streptomyces sp. NBC_01201]